MMIPIEGVFSKVKFFAGNLLTDSINCLNLEDLINQSIVTVTSTDCYKYVHESSSSAAKERL